MNYCPMGSFAYYIQPKDTLWEISRKFNSDVNAIMVANPGIDPENLLIGQMICIPQSDIFYNDVMYDTSNLKNQNTPNVKNPMLYLEPEPTPVSYEVNPMMPETQTSQQNMMMMPFQEFANFEFDGADMVIDDMDLHNHLKMLWNEHVNWFIMAANDIIFNLPNKENSKKRLLRNAVDFGNALEPFIGDDNAETFEKLLKKYIQSGLRKVEAIKNKNKAQEALEEKNQSLIMDTMVQFLNSVNPAWDTEEWQSLLMEHGNLLNKYLNLVINNQLEEATVLVDDIETQALEMAEYMITGLEEQFSDMIE